jgi:hypothetical protein
MAFMPVDVLKYSHTSGTATPRHHVTSRGERGVCATAGLLVQRPPWAMVVYIVTSVLGERGPCTETE